MDYHCSSFVLSVVEDADYRCSIYIRCNGYDAIKALKCYYKLNIYVVS